MRWRQRRHAARADQADQADGGADRVSGGAFGCAGETAASARETQARGLPFITFRAASDGNGDPLGLPGFPDQFFTYYRLAAHNAAAVAVPFLDRL